MAKTMTPMEKAVGRRLPAQPRHIDTVMSRWAEDGEKPEKIRLPPSDDWLRPAFRKAVRNGWLRRTNTAISIMGSRAEHYFEATPSGFAEARTAKVRVDAANAARAEWARESQQAIREGRFPPNRSQA